MKQAKKISVKSLTNKPSEILKAMPEGVTSVFVARIVGSAKGFAVKETDWGPQVIFKGDFIAWQSLEDDSTKIRQKVAILPSGWVTSKLIAMLREKKGEVEFVVDLIFEKLNLKKEAATYHYTLRQVVDLNFPAIELDPLKRLVKKAAELVAEESAPGMLGCL